jgi:UDP-glucose:(heptosyl)LPS alpha-1,3-glucosyltransferase
VPGVRLVLVSGSDATADRAVAEAEGVAGRVTFVPATRQIHRHFAAADLFVFPTLYDPYGMVISEAMATGLPVVTSRAAGAAEIITHGVDGWLTDGPWDVDQIAAGLGALAADAGLRARMGAAARAAVEAYTWDRAADQTMAVYREVLAEKRR